MGEAQASTEIPAKNGGKIAARSSCPLLIPVLQITVLHPPVIRQFFVRHALGEIATKDLWNPPFPTFGMAVGEGKVAALRVAVGGNIPPDARVAPNLQAWHSECAIVNLVLVHVQERKEPTGIRIPDLCKFPEARIPLRVWIQFGHAIDAEAHVVTAP